jgi:hypothetical protein
VQRPDDDIADMALEIGNNPGVSTAFKKCMEGRCGCGGSSFGRIRIQCDDDSSCGTCGDAWGCNLGGSTLTYCDTRNVECRCVNTVFHEMSHSCGALHTAQYFQQGCMPGDQPCAIGDWFDDQCTSPSGLLAPPLPGGKETGDE